MADGGERTAAEREAARLERERRRAQQANEPVETDAAGVPSTAANTELEDRPADDRSAPDVGEHADGHPADGAEFETDEHELELPSGTRRVSHLETMAAGRPRKAVVKRKRKPVRRAARTGPRPKHSWVVRAASLIALLGAAAVIWFLAELFQPFHGAPHGRVTVLIPAHTSSSQIGDLLAKDGVISSSFFFELRATLDGDRGDLRSGLYHLQQGMSYGAALNALTKAPPAAKVTRVTIIEGRSRDEVDALLHSQGVRGSYLAATRSTRLLDYAKYGLRHPPRTLEGFLFPDTYDLIEPIKLSELVDDQLQTFKQNFAKVNMSYARSKHLTPFDVLIIASLIEAEAGTARDRPLVSSVIYNRLRDGMPLQLDATTRFATGDLTGPLTESQLHSSSPYNTRVHVGLPPGPIDSPGLAALQAAAHPAHTNYLYFFNRSCSRYAIYASSYQQFLAEGSLTLNKHC